MTRRTTFYTIIFIMILASFILAACDTQEETAQATETEGGETITTEAPE